ncbi:MAG: peptidylprolyl isomerase [Bacteroidales bacterium]|nr:peptidylprolyl isomerase [Bacteroidales bacterium]
MAKVIIKTPLGDITVRLYDETPAHRDNFLKLAKEGFYNGTIFHRVIKNFMIQGGDPESKGAPQGKHLGSGDAGYTLPAEFVYPQYFHKKGALSAARLGDEANPERRSSGCQFYIVTGEVYSAGKLTQMEKQLTMQAQQAFANKFVVEHRSEILEMRKNRDQKGMMEMQEKLDALIKALPAEKFTAEQREAYTTVGGTPFLDNNYTVFGEVESGLEVADAIQNVSTGVADRPLEDVVMTSVEVIEE